MNIKLFALAAVSMAFTACTDNESLNLDNEPVKAVINATIADAFKTRAYDTTWENGDQIGITGTSGWETYTNMTYNWNASGMLQAILRRTKKTSTTTHLRMWRSPPTILGKRN